jgi:hypothetical protein
VLRRVPYEPYIAELRRWQKILNRVKELGQNPFSHPVDLGDIVAAAMKLKKRSDTNWS